MARELDERSGIAEKFVEKRARSNTFAHGHGNTL